MIRRKIGYGLLLMMVVFLLPSVARSFVITKGDRTYIVDRQKEAWDVTEAKKNGYQPFYFNYGMGRYAFAPLDDEGLLDEYSFVPGRMRVIAFEDDDGGRAFSVNKLRRHEIANSWQNGTPVAVGY